MQAQGRAEHLFHSLQIVRVDAQLWFAAEQRLLLQQTLDLFNQRRVIYRRGMADHLTCRLERHLHQARGDNAVQRVQRILELADQLLHPGMDRRLL
ncbi:hypothetical protein D3C76_1549120 [compost metagenome]